MINDFKLIKGIGPKIEQRLQNAGIRTFSELAALSAEEIASILPAVSARQITKQGWIPQARKLVLDKARSKARPKKTFVPTNRQHYENFTFEFLLDEKNETRRLRVVHIQSGDVDTWVNWDSERLTDFLARHTGSRLQYAMSVIPSPIKPKLTSSQPALTGPSSKDLIKTKSIPSMSGLKENYISPSSPALESIPQNPGSAENMTSVTVHQQGTSPQVTTSSVIKIHLLTWKVLLGNADQSLGNLTSDQAYDVSLTLDLNNISLPDGSYLETHGTLYARKLSGGPRQMLSEKHGVVSYAKILDLTIGNVILSAGYYRLEALVTFKLVGMVAKRQPGLMAFLELGLVQVC